MATVTVTVRVNPRDFARGVKYAKAFGGRFDGRTKLWTIPADRPELGALAAYGLILVAAPVTTAITIRKPDGTTKTLERPCAFSAAEREAWAADARTRFGVEVVAWEERGGPAYRPLSDTRPRALMDDPRRCRGCGRVGDDGECGLGDY